jgi:hypothetical protein
LMRATARNFVLQNDQVTELVLSFGALPDVRLALGEATWLQLGVGAAVVLQRPRFVLQFQTAGQRSELSGPQVVRAELGLGLVQIF